MTKFNYFYNFFQRLTFPTNNCQRLKCISNPVEHSTMELFRNFFFKCKIPRKHLRWSLILKKLQVSILKLHWKKGLRYRCFVVDFCEMFKTPLLQNTPRRPLLLYRKKYFINKIVKKPLRKREKMETACKKNNETGKRSMQSHWGLSTIENYFSASVWKNSFLSIRL